MASFLGSGAHELPHGTVFKRADGEVVLPTKPSLFVLHWLQLLTLNIVGGKGKPYSSRRTSGPW